MVLASSNDRQATLGDLRKEVADLKTQLESLQRLVPEGGEDRDVVFKDGSRVVWKNVLALFMKVPSAPKSNLYLCLKHKDNPTLVIADAVVIVIDEAGDPLWYVQFDYLRGTATP